jgi:hypothetical protein
VGERPLVPAGFIPDDEPKGFIPDEPKSSAPSASPPSAIETMLADSPADPWDVRVAKFIARQAKAHPVTAGATVGSALATGGASIPAQIGLAALGAAGGAGYGMLAKGAGTGDYGTPTGNAERMFDEGASAAVGQGVGSAIAAGAPKIAKVLYRSALRPSVPLQKDFGDLAATGLRDAIPVNEAGTAEVNAMRGSSADKAAGVLAAKDAERPTVAGLLPPAQGIELPNKTGVLMGRDTPNIPGARDVTYPQLVGAREVLDRGMGTARSAAGDAPFPADAESALAALEQKFKDQRPYGMSLADTNRLKQTAQDLANAAYQDPLSVHTTGTQFNKGVATGARQAIEARAPEVGPINARTQELIGLQRALENAQMRNPGPMSLRALPGYIAPGLTSQASILMNKAAPYAPAMLRSLLAALGGGGS